MEEYLYKYQSLEFLKIICILNILNKLKFCNTFANKDAINVDVLDKQKATIDTKPVAYVAENIVIDDN
ncbi:hypothetical protein IBE48_09695, partial [Francisella philomiragia]